MTRRIGRLPSDEDRSFLVLTATGDGEGIHPGRPADGAECGVLHPAMDHMLRDETSVDRVHKDTAIDGDRESEMQVDPVIGRCRINVHRSGWAGRTGNTGDR